MASLAVVTLQHFRLFCHRVSQMTRQPHAKGHCAEVKTGKVSLSQEKTNLADALVLESAGFRLAFVQAPCRVYKSVMRSLCKVLDGFLFKGCIGLSQGFLCHDRFFRKLMGTAPKFEDQTLQARCVLHFSKQSYGQP